MATNYIIDSTDGSRQLTINSGTLNGPGGSTVSSDLRLYGDGNRAWGEGVDENFYRILESFACHEKVLNDYNPTTGLNDFVPDGRAPVPKDSHDLGALLGINKPVRGQLWYNKTQSTLFMYAGTGTDWRSVGTGELNNNILIDTNTGNATLTIRGDSATNRDFLFQTKVAGVGKNRWLIRADNQAETGTDVGSDLNIYGYRDDGTSSFKVLTFERQSGKMDLKAESIFRKNIGLDGLQPGGGVADQGQIRLVAPAKTVSSVTTYYPAVIFDNKEGTFRMRLTNPVATAGSDGITLPIDTLNSIVPLTINAATGAVALGVEPTSNSHAATKKYVDDALPTSVLTNKPSTNYYTVPVGPDTSTYVRLDGVPYLVDSGANGTPYTFTTGQRGFTLIDITIRWIFQPGQANTASIRSYLVTGAAAGAVGNGTLMRSSSVDPGSPVTDMSTNSHVSYSATLTPASQYTLAFDALNPSTNTLPFKALMYVRIITF